MTGSRILPSYHGPHVPPAQACAERVDWRRSLPRTAWIRVREHTCACRYPIFELCTAGGLWFVRRLSKGTPLIVESPWESARTAQELWVRILSGQAI